MDFVLPLSQEQYEQEEHEQEQQEQEQPSTKSLSEVKGGKWGKHMLDTKIWIQKHFWVKKLSGPKTFCVQNHIGPKKYTNPKINQFI